MLHHLLINVQLVPNNLTISQRLFLFVVQTVSNFSEREKNYKKIFRLCVWDRVKDGGFLSLTVWHHFNARLFKCIKNSTPFSFFHIFSLCLWCVWVRGCLCVSQFLLSVPSSYITKLIPYHWLFDCWWEAAKTNSNTQYNSKKKRFFFLKKYEKELKREGEREWVIFCPFIRPVHSKTV